LKNPSKLFPLTLKESTVDEFCFNFILLKINKYQNSTENKGLKPLYIFITYLLFALTDSFCPFIEERLKTVRFFSSFTIVKQTVSY